MNARQLAVNAHCCGCVVTANITGLVTDSLSLPQHSLFSFKGCYLLLCACTWCHQAK